MKEKEKDRAIARSFSKKLLILAFSGSLRLLLALYAGLLIMLSLTELGKNAGLNTLSLKTTKRAIKCFILFYSDFCHLYFPSLRFAKRYNLIIFTKIVYSIKTTLSTYF